MIEDPTPDVEDELLASAVGVSNIGGIAANSETAAFLVTGLTQNRIPSPPCVVLPDHRDLDGDGVIGNGDFAIILAAFGLEVASAATAEDGDGATLNYDNRDGNVTIDPSGAPGEIVTNYVLKSADGFVNIEEVLFPVGGTDDRAVIVDIQSKECPAAGSWLSGSTGSPPPWAAAPPRRSCRNKGDRDLIEAVDVRGDRLFSGSCSDTLRYEGRGGFLSTPIAALWRATRRRPNISPRFLGTPL